MKKICILLMSAVLIMSCACAVPKLTVPPEVQITAAPKGTPLPEIIGDAFNVAGEKIRSGEVTALHFYYDNSYDGDMHASQLIYDTAWDMLARIELGEETGEPGICDAGYFCLFTFTDGSEIGFSFIADEYFSYGGKTYRIIDPGKAKTLRRYLSGMMDQYSDETLKNAGIGAGMTELAPVDCNGIPSVSVPVDLNGDGVPEMLEFTLQRGGDLYASGIQCTCSGEEISIGYFIPDPGKIRLFTADLGEKGSILAIVNYSSPACRNVTVFVYMAEGRVYSKEYPDMFPTAFIPEEQSFLMTDETVLSLQDIISIPV